MNTSIHSPPGIAYSSSITTLIILYQHSFKNSSMTQILSQSQKFGILKETTQGYPFKCKLFLNLLLSQLPEGRSIQTPKDFKKAYAEFTSIFTKLTHSQKLFYIGQLSDHVASSLRNEKNGTTIIVNNIETTCQFKNSMMGISYWERRNFKYQYEFKRIKLFNTKKNQVIDLRDYLVRESASEKNAMVLETVSKNVPEKMSKLTVKFSNNSIFREVYRNIRGDIIELSEKKIEELLRDDLKDVFPQKMSQNTRDQQGFTILTTKNLTDYFNRKEKLTAKLNSNRNNAYMLATKSNTKIYRSKQHKKCHYLEQTIYNSQSLNQIKQEISILSSHSTKGKNIVEVLEVFNKNVTANYFKFDVGVKEYEFLVINEKQEKEGFYQQTMKAATDFFLDISIDFIIATLRKISDGQYSFQISIILNTHSKKSSKINNDITSLLFAMAFQNKGSDTVRRSSKMIEGLPAVENFSVMEIVDQSSTIYKNVNHQSMVDLDQNFTSSSGRKNSSSSSNHEVIQQQDDDQCFYSIVGDEDQIADLRVFSSFEEKSMSKKNSMKASLKDVMEHTEPTVTQDITFLKVKAFNEPLPPAKLKILTQHYLFGEWVKSSKGGVVCANEEVMKEQKRIIKLVITRIGSNIFKGNSCMNVSLPIQLFRKESFLACIAQNMTFSPLLIEPYVKADPLERMKMLSIFEISINALALSTKKPFNPILGETYQGQIAGCPIYLQQISHHPPITSIYYIGRGFKLYGTMQIEVNMRLNYVRGVNHCSLTIEFDNGDKVFLDVPALIINGLILGERTIYYDGTAHLIDFKNHLVTQLTYNAANAKKMFSFKTESPDYLTGEIYKVTPAFLQKYTAEKYKTSLKKDDGNKCLSKIQGEWNGKIFIDEQQVFDFEEQLPVQIQNCAYPLPSDSNLRSDVIELSKGDLNTAQDQKDRLEQLQRKDKKLRHAKK